MQQKYETEISQKLEEHRREIESIKQKHQAELNRKLQETTEQAKRNSETDLSRKLETERQRFELELKKLNATLVSSVYHMFQVFFFCKTTPLIIQSFHKAKLYLFTWFFH